LKWVAEVEPSEFFAFKERQDLFRQRLTGPLLRLIAQLTGLRLHVLWHSPLDFQEPGEMPVLCPRARQRTGAKGRPPKRCESCLQRRWKPALSPANQGRRFIGQCGATNFCACLQVDKVCPLTLVLQARVAPRSPSPHSVSQGRNTRFRAEHAGEAVSSSAFHHAVALARLILHDLESTARARMARSGLENALRRLNNTHIEAARLRGELRHRLPDLPESTVQPGLGSHARKLVDAMRDYVHQHYHRPISLGELASAMKMNASYLSALFSETTGVTFHQFLEEVRLSKARELLRDPRNRIREVACAAGYASPDAFRHAFKAHEGLSPEAWRAGQ
jgi:AraC-like DNA-binding protein